MKKPIKMIDFALRRSLSCQNDFYLEIYRPKTNTFGYTRYISMDDPHRMNKRELKLLADFIYKFIGENHE
jgi:hypothetical protein